MPQPLPISKRKTQNHLTTNKNINKHRTNMFVFMSKKKKNHTFVCCQPHLFYLMLYIEDYTKKDKKCVNLSSTRLFFIKKIFNWKKMFLFQKRFAIAINLLRRQFYIWRLSEPLELLLFPISTSPTLTLLYFYFCFHFVSVSLNLLIFSVNSWVSLSNFFDFTGWLWHLITTWNNLTQKKLVYLK